MIDAKYLKDHFAEVVWFTINKDWTADEFNEKIGFPSDNDAKQQIIAKDEQVAIPTIQTLLNTNQIDFESWIVVRQKESRIKYKDKAIINIFKQYLEPTWTDKQILTWLEQNS